MTFTDAAAEVLRLVGRPLHYKEITDIAIEKNLLSHVGKSPEVTMGARLAATLKKDASDNPLVRVKPGVFALREWDDKTIKSGLEPKKGGRRGARPDQASARGRDKGDDDEVLIGDGEEVEEAEPELEEEPQAELLDAEPDATGDEDLVPEPMAVAVPLITAAAPRPAPVAAPSQEAVTTPARAEAPVDITRAPLRGDAPVDHARAAAPLRVMEEDDEEAVEVTEPEEPQGPDEAMRAEAAAGAAE